MTFEQLKEIVAYYVQSNMIANGTFTATKDNVAGLLDKVGKMIFIDGDYTDKLPELNGDDLPLGKSIEEWFEDLAPIFDYDATGANALAPTDPTYRPVSYSYSLGKKVFKTTRRYNDLQRACNTEGDFEALVIQITKRLYDSAAQFFYDAKRELLGKFAGAAIAEQSASVVYAKSKEYAVNTILKSSSSSETRGIVVKAIASTNTLEWAGAVKAGYIVELNMVETIAIPTDTTTGEAFIKAVKGAVEKANDTSEGYSLNGASNGAVEGSLKLYIKQGIMPTIDVDVIAGAFHEEKVAIPAELKVIKDFGTADDKIFAILVDSRGVKLHNDYRAVRDQENAAGDFINYFYHTENTAFYSRNTFIKVFKSA